MVSEEGINCRGNGRFRFDVYIFRFEFLVFLSFISFTFIQIIQNFLLNICYDIVICQILRYSNGFYFFVKIVEWSVKRVRRIGYVKCFFWILYKIKII